jgi:hypothetical protein
VGDTEIVLAGTGWLIINALLLSLAGFGNFEFGLPTDPNPEPTEDTEAGEPATDSPLLRVARCFSLTQLVDGLCEPTKRVIQFIADLASIVLGFFGFLFDLLTFNIPEIPGWLNGIIIFPTGGALGFVALKTIRGAGG